MSIFVSLRLLRLFIVGDKVLYASLKQPAYIPCKEFFYGNAARTYNERLDRMELFTKQRQAIIAGSTPTFNLYGNQLLVELYDEIHLVILLTPEVEPVVILVGLIQQMRTIRGEQVLIDRDLAYIYQVEVKQMNRQVKRNIERFPDDFMFQLTKEEYDSLKCQNGTSNTRGGDRRALPYAFTQQGIGMLSGLLRSQVAIDTNIRIMRAFVNMRRFLIANMQIAQRLDRVELQQLQSRQWMDQTEDKISMILDKIEERHPKLLSEQIFGAGCIWDAWAYISELVRSAKERIELIDNFVDDRVLSLLMKRGENVSVIIHSRFTKDFLTDLEKHNKQYPKVEFKQIPHKNHDRFLIIDDAIYLLGASVKDMGNGMCAITKLTTTPETILRLLV